MSGRVESSAPACILSPLVMQRHILLILGRVLLAAAVLLALPYSHVQWGATYPGDGQQAFGIGIMLTLLGAAFASAHFLAGAVVQFGLRRKPWWWTGVVDASAVVTARGVLGLQRDSRPVFRSRRTIA